MNIQKRMTALFVAVSFLVLLLASAMPLRADRSPDQAGTAISNAEQGPSFIEEEGSSSSVAKKKSILPIIIGVVAVGAIAAFLILVVFKTKYDITGTWDFNFTSTSPSHSWTWTIAFSGDEKSGNFIDEFNDTGAYRVDGKNVTISYTDWDIQLTGTFDGKDKMTGNATFTGLTIGGQNISSATWIANRTSKSAAKPNTPVAQSFPGRKVRKSDR